jgi:hypothetical protein
MILSHGPEEVFENKEKVIRCKSFTDFAARHGDAIHGLDRPLMQPGNALQVGRQGLRHRAPRPAAARARRPSQGHYRSPAQLMRSVEEKIAVPEGRKDDFRREIMNYIGAPALDGKRFDCKTNERPQKAPELKLFEGQKDTVQLTSLVSNVVDKATQEKIDVVKSRLTRHHGYRRCRPQRDTRMPSSRCGWEAARAISTPSRAAGRSTTPALPTACAAVASGSSAQVPRPPQEGRQAAGRSVRPAGAGPGEPAPKVI